MDEHILNLIEFVNRVESFEGTATELSDLLKKHLDFGVTASVLSKKIKKNVKTLHDNNIEFKGVRTRYQRTISLRKIAVVCDVSGGSDANIAL